MQKQYSVDKFSYNKFRLKVVLHCDFIYPLQKTNTSYSTQLIV